jgi:hypothetical protein
MFCSGGTSKEHIVPKWMIRDCDLFQIPMKLAFGHQNSAGKFETITEEMSPYRFYTCEVCETCNNGWMSRLEQSAQKILAPLLEVPVPASENEFVRGLFTQSHLLTLWLLKTCATFGKKWAIHVPTWILEALPLKRIPPCVYADISIVDQCGFYLGMSRQWTVAIDDQLGTRENQDSFRLTWQINHLVLRLSHFPFAEKHQLKPRYPVCLYPRFKVGCDIIEEGIAKRRYRYQTLEQLEHETVFVARKQMDPLHPLSRGR